MVPGEDHEMARCTKKINRRLKGLVAALILGGTVSIGSLVMQNYTGDNTWKGLLYGTLGSMAIAGIYVLQSVRHDAGSMNGIMLSNIHKLIERKYAKELKEMRGYSEAITTEDSSEESPPKYQH